MPWGSSKTSVGGHNKRAAKSKKTRRAWSKTANAVLKRTGDEGQAIRVANSLADKFYGKAKK